MKRAKILFSALFLVSLMAGSTLAAQSPQVPLAAAAIPQFVDPLPMLSVAGGPIQTVFGNQPLTIRMCQFKAKLLPSTFVAPAGSTYDNSTWVWGYLPDPTGSSTCAQLISQYGDVNGVLGTYLGPVVLNERNNAPDCVVSSKYRASTDFLWINDLPTSSAANKVLAWKYSTDQTLHWADPLNAEANNCNKAPTFPAFNTACAQNYDGPVPAVIHLHGGEVPPELDGGPDAWVTSDGLKQGHAFYSFAGAPAKGAIYKYANTQEASPIWFHDHALGITRLNVYAGVAGGYLISDPNLTLPAGLHPYGLQNGSVFEPTVPLIVQDRMFDTNGQLFFPADTAGGLLWSPNPEHPYWVPEFVGDVIMVNGKAWPKFNAVEKRYRFLFLNGSNARTYEMFLIDPVTLAAGPNMWVIATDGGYLDKPVMVKKLTMMPGERYEVIIDFAGFPNPTNGWLLKNNAKTPYPGGAAPKAGTGTVMKFFVAPGAVTNNSFNPALAGAIRPATKKVVRLPGTPGGPAIVTAAGATQNVQKTRALTLNEVMGMPQNVTDPVTGLAAAYPGGPLEILMNNTKWGGESPRPYGDFQAITVGGVTSYYSELPREGDTEIWEIINLTADAHPIHLHLVQFQVIDRQAFNVTAYLADYNLAFPVVSGSTVCTGGVYCPGFGPPMNYNTTPKLGGNPDVYAINANGKPKYLQAKPAPPAPNEQGWKDTVMALNGQVTRLAVRWAPTDLPVETTGSGLAPLYFPFDPSGGQLPLKHGYVWHCHIIDHEDNEMMRPDLVDINPLAPLPGMRPLVKGTAY